jgi:hypothetical protein
LGNFAYQQMAIVDQVVDPGAPGVLVHPHAPVRGHLFIRVAEKGGQVSDVFGRNTGDLFDLLGGVIL